MNCAVCDRVLATPLLNSSNAQSLTSLCTIRSSNTQTYVCGFCAHAQSPVLDDKDDFYSNQYEILIDSTEEDQIYRYGDDGSTIYRYRHQAEVALDCLELPTNARVLEYGAAKGATLRLMLQQREDIVPFVYDVSDMYRSFWDEFVPVTNSATFSIPHEWVGHLDAVVSFFVFEHIADLARCASEVRSTLRVGGKWHIVVPNPIANTGDLVVVDHTQHFSAASLDTWLRSQGFAVDNLSDQLHQSALVATATKVSETTLDLAPELTQTQQDFDLLQQACAYWSDYFEGSGALQAALTGQKVAIYGASFYGSLAFSVLSDPAPISCFVDRSPFLQGRQRFGRPIVAPGDLPQDIDTIVMGVNPVHAQAILATVAEWINRDLKIVYP